MVDDLVRELSRINDPNLWDDFADEMLAADDGTLARCREHSLAKARRCLGAVLARLREPSEAMLLAGAEAMDALDYPATDGDPMFAVECSVGLYGPEALVAWRAMWAAFARTHRLGPPGSQERAHGLEMPDAG